MRKLIPLILLLVVSQVIVAWDPITHYSIGLDLGYQGKSGNMNLPDTWPTMPVTKTGISDWFCWSHAVQRTGRTWEVPNIPIYPDDGREPGQIMNILAKHKIEWENAVERQTAIDTAIGFVGHNGMDRDVHWDYFGGGSISNWRLHETKEEWADYVVWVWKGGGGTFENGKAKTFFGDEIKNMKTIMPLEGNSKVIQIAQKAAIKNRRKMDFEGGKEINTFNDYDSVSTINSRIKNMNKEMETWVRVMNKKRYDELTKLAKDQTWDTDDMEAQYEESKKRARKWIGTYCQ